jgi:hypothetical protein
VPTVNVTGIPLEWFSSPDAEVRKKAQHQLIHNTRKILRLTTPVLEQVVLKPVAGFDFASKYY